MASINNENEFRSLIETSAAKNKSIHLISIPDELKRVLSFHPDLARFVIQKPYDMGMLKGGHYVAIELKNESKFLAWNVSGLEAHQKENLKKAVNCGGSGVVLLRFKKGLSVRDKKRLNINLWAIDKTFILPIQWICKQKVTSFTIEYLTEHCEELEFEKYEKKYDLNALWKKRPTSP